MQTKTISLASIPGKLSRLEMKEISGGKKLTVSCSTGPGYSQTSPGNCTGMTQSECQTAATNWCSNTTGCISCSVS